MDVTHSPFVRLLTPFIFNCLLLASYVAAQTNLTTDQYALLAFKSGITEDPHGILQNWTISSSVCHWGGVTCDMRHGRVTKLDISNLSLAGSIHPDLGNLSFLVSIDIHSNRFGGTLPNGLARLKRLKYITLDDNDFAGEVPSWFSSFSQLQYLSLRNNSFTSFNSFVLSASSSNESKLATLDLSFNRNQGEIPEAIGSLRNLNYLSIESNELTGSIPSSMCNISTLGTLLLSQNHLSGEMPQEIRNLQTLEYFDIRNNMLTGPIPSGLGDLRKLETVFLCWNQFRGMLPESISNISHLKLLGASGNQLSGSIPSTIWNLSDLTVLFLANNTLTGNIPSSICHLSYLKMIYVSYNSLEGTLPDCLGNLSSRLDGIELSVNNFRGSIPTTFTKGCAMQYLRFSRNQFEGTLPQSLVNCTRLKFLDVGDNKLQGPFPIWLEILPYLRVLVLSSNRFSGSIPDSKREISFPKLQLLDISNNDFTGRLPTSCLKNFGGLSSDKENETAYSNYFDLSQPVVGRPIAGWLQITIMLKGVPIKFPKLQRTFTMIDMSFNMFHGDIPSSFGNLTSLRHLNLSHNNLTGHIPVTLGLLTDLEALDLSWNHLEGKIPQPLTSLTFLSKFNVSYNNLLGSIPQSGGQFLTFSNDSYIGNSRLCGQPLSKKCKDENHEAGVPPPMVDEEAMEKGLFDGISAWHGALMGYGFGLFIGVVLGFLYCRCGIKTKMVQ